ncbi:hypothetical protein BC629DRAFT_1463421 [Irpex lacteus]|nr:hypothetical protein BC629DRAFT_1463421 [Irpex lacteus]
MHYLFSIYLSFTAILYTLYNLRLLFTSCRLVRLLVLFVSVELCVYNSPPNYLFLAWQIA